VGRKILGRIYTHSILYSPAAVGTSENKALISVLAGARVTSVSARVKVAATGTTSTISVGDGTAVAGFLAATDADTTLAGTLVDGAGTMLANAGGKLYTVADTVDADYVIGATPGAVAPVWEIRITVRQEW
jgi:hypothetical protein